MAEIVTSLLAMIAFVVIGLVFVIWMVSQIQEFAYFFGFRLSDVVVGDLSSLMTASAGVPGKVVAEHEVEGSKGVTRVTYRLYIKNTLVCAQSIWGSEDGGTRTTDCYSVPSFDVENKLPRKYEDGVTQTFTLKTSKSASYFDNDGVYRKVKINVCEGDVPNC